MELDLTTLWSAIITLVIMPMAWVFTYLVKEVKRIQILLNKTREEYATKADLRDTSTRIIDTLNRLEDKLDKVLTNGSR